MRAIACAIGDVIPPEANSIAGLTVGAGPVSFGTAAVAATRARAPKSSSIRKEAQDQGVTGCIAGVSEPGDRVVAVEDMATRGRSVLDADLAVRAAGADPLLLLSVMDRDGTASALAARHNLEFHALVTAPDLGPGYEGG